MLVLPGFEGGGLPGISMGESHFLTPSLSWRRDYQMSLALLVQKSDPRDHRGVSLASVLLLV